MPELSDDLKLTVAGRYDTFDFMDASGFSPRAALVWTPNPRHTFRASYNVGSFGPALQMYIDFPLVNIAAPILAYLADWIFGFKAKQPIDRSIIYDDRFRRTST